MREVQSLARGLQIIELLSNAEEDLGNKEISTMLGLDKSSISRFMHTLIKYGYVERDTRTGSYKCGPRIVQLSNKILHRMPLRDHAHPFLRQLVNLTGECAHLAISAQGQVLSIDEVKVDLMYQVSADVGTLLPLHSTALGKVLMALGDLPTPDTLQSYTPRTIVDPEQLKLHLAQVRTQGYAIDDEENIIGVRCVAAPVFGYDDELLGAMGISGPGTRVTLEQIKNIAETVADVASSLSKRLKFGT
jgi:DNA-binding IclR family transcriptional regulator